VAAAAGVAVAIAAAAVDVAMIVADAVTMRKVARS
jgi:hypothetical protein